MKREEFKLLFDSELDRIAQPDLIKTIKDRLVEPRLEFREWDYGEEGTKFPCWIAIEDRESNTAIGYCLEGFGPSYPWGLLFIEGEYMSIGMDSGWFISLEEVVRDSMFWHGNNPDNYEVS